MELLQMIAGDIPGLLKIKMRYFCKKKILKYWKYYKTKFNKTKLNLSVKLQFRQNSLNRSKFKKAWENVRLDAPKQHKREKPKENYFKIKIYINCYSP